ncbi:hypothetical protein CRE_22846 [Caenorhabditis remanei]|uniref:F-box domain-containing protein n=1 Tax=Caenorhabditis remanei TaxID=31234 RepID=E3MHI4_CAERE|nr:hypothetical protein CRE_22846 [Caenorhabditis remanei]
MDNIPKPFPLLHLPYLALEEVLSIMRPFDLINFSMASSKSKIITKCVLRTKGNKKYELEVDTFEEPKISIRGSNTFFEYRLTSEKSRSEKKEHVDLTSRIKCDRVWIYSENVIIDWMELLRTVMEYYTFKRFVVSFGQDTFPAEKKSIVDFLRSHMTSVDDCVIRGKTEADEDVSYFLKNIDVTETLIILSKLSDQFQLKIENSPNNLLILNGNWISYDQFINFNANRIEIQKSKITNVELNMFLISWMTSRSNQNLEYLKIQVTELDTLDTILNLPHEVMGADVIRHGKTVKHGIIELRGGTDIKRNDGATGTVFIEMVDDQMMLYMCVSYLL